MSAQPVQRRVFSLKAIGGILTFITAVIGLVVVLIQAGVIPFHNSASASMNIAGHWHGDIFSSVYNERTSLDLLINQPQGQKSINGFATIAPPLIGSGQFTGTIDADAIQFKVQSAQGTTHLNEPLLFSGKVQPDGSLSGTYCGVDEQNLCDPNEGRGSWNVSKS